MRTRALLLTDRLAALREALEAADEAPGTDAAPVRALLAKAGARTALGDSTVVALAGATGSGKSTLFNALAGSELSAPGVRRPTTGSAHACVWSSTPEHTEGLLDWLGVPRRHVQADPEPALDGLVLLDLPDHDSTRLEHRLEVDRLVELVDVLVWVLDPQKYADAAVHERYLVPYAGHAGVLLVVLNQADRLGADERGTILADLRGLLDREGLAAVPVLAVSGRTGFGSDDLHAELVRRVAARRAASERLAGDVRAVARRAGGDCGGGAVQALDRAARAGLVDALADAAGVPVVTAAVERSVRSQGAAATGWPLMRGLRGLRPDPLRRLHLAGDADERVRTSLPPAGGAALARVSGAVRTAREASGTGLPEAWRDGLRETAQDREAALPAALDRAVAGTPLDAGRAPRWWSAAAGLQWLLLVIALVGALWLLGLAALGALQLDQVLPLPRASGVPLPTLLLVAGLLAGLLVALVCRPLVRATARRRRRRAQARLRERVAAVADGQVLAPLAAQRAAYDRWCAALERAGS